MFLIYTAAVHPDTRTDRAISPLPALARATVNNGFNFTCQAARGSVGAAKSVHFFFMAAPTTIDGVTTGLDFTTNALRVMKARYLMTNESTGELETPEEMFRRVASKIASTEKDKELWTRRFEEVMLRFEFIPAGRTLANAGARTALVSNFVVLHMDDSLESIFETLKEAALLQQAGSGVGFPFHLLRPAGLKCKQTLGNASGPMSFLRVYSDAFQIIQQHGRHGANMALMRIDHPDILEFIDGKSRDGTFQNFNFSIGFTDEFMQRVISNDPEPWMCQWQGTKMPPRRITRDAVGRIADISDRTLSAPELMNEIIDSAWRNGEPGCVFIDTVNRSNPVPGCGPIECCNPCGEQFLHSGDACNLGAVNLEKFVTADGRVDSERLADVVRVAVRMLDDVIDLTEFPVARVSNTFRANRRMGLGIMGLADMLFLLKLPYNSAEGREVAGSVMKLIRDTAIDESVKLGAEKGNFPHFDKSIWAGRYPTMRNASLTNVAPTGSTSMLLDVSSGVEPYFALAYRRGNCLAGPMKPFVNKHLSRALSDAGCLNDAVMDQILQTGTLQHVVGIPEEIKRVYVTSLDITATDHILMQSAVQKNCCNAISKTINFANNATRDMVRTGFIEGWMAGCKGLTVYRNGSREFQVLETNAKKEEPVATSITTCTNGSCDT
jgi:ribonucleoside-diphosphate reductase alpha chain